MNITWSIQFEYITGIFAIVAKIFTHFNPVGMMSSTEKGLYL